MLVTLLVSQLLAAGRTETQLASNLRGDASLQAATDGAVQQAIFHLLDHSPGHWAANGTPHAIEVAGFSATVRIFSEAGKINPNSAPAGLLNALLRRVGADRGTAALIAAGIEAWRSPLEPVAQQIPRYKAAGRDYAPPDQPFQSLDELGLVLGMTPQLLAAITPYLSLDRDAQPNPAVASPVVLAAIADWTGLQTQSIGQPPDDSLVTIRVETLGPGGTKASRKAVIQTGFVTGTTPFRILSWD